MQPLTILHISGLPNRSPSAEAHVASLGPTERHALGCLRSDHSCREPPRFTGRKGGREVREVFVVRRAFGALQLGWNEASGSQAVARTQNLGLACPPVLLSSCKISSRPELPGS